jgi:chromosome segregation ATPase
MFGKKKKDEAQKEEGQDSAQPGTEDGTGGGIEGLKNISASAANAGEQKEEKPTAHAPEKKAEHTPAPSPAPEKSPEPEPEAADEEEHISVKPRRKGSDPEMEKMKKQLSVQRESMKELERERADAMKKSDELAGLIEDLSNEVKESKSAPEKHQQQPMQQMPDMEPKLRQMEEKTTAQIGSLKAAIDALTEKKEDDKKDDEDVASTMKKMFESRMKDLYDKLDEVKTKPAPGITGEGGEFSGGLSAIGGGIELKKEVDSMKKSMKDLATLLDAFKEEAENRFMALDRELQVLERFPSMEQKMEQFEKKLGPDNVQKLRSLIADADDLKEEVIPLVVKRVVEDKVEPHTRRVKEVMEKAEKIDKSLAEFSIDAKAIRKDIDSLYKFGERLGKLEDDSGATKKLIVELRLAMKELDKSQKKDMLDKIKELFPPMIEAEAVAIRKEFAGRFSFFSEKLHAIENMVSEAHKEIAALSAMKGEMDGLADRLDDVDEKMDKTAVKIEGLHTRDDGLMEKIEDLETPKEIITQLDNKTKDMLDIREFFVRRGNQLEERINQLDERAAPVRKLHESFEKLSLEFAGMKEMQKKLEAKTADETKQFQQLIAEHAEEKKILEQKINEQKARISTLLKEFR